MGMEKDGDWSVGATRLLVSALQAAIRSIDDDFWHVYLFFWINGINPTNFIGYPAVN